MKQKTWAAWLIAAVCAAGLAGCEPGDLSSLWNKDRVSTPENTQAVLFESAEVEPVTGGLVSVNARDYVKLADYKSMTIQKPEVTEEEVTEEIEKRLFEAGETPKGKDAAVETGDEAVINYFGMIGYETVDQSTANNYTLVVGSGEMAAGFEEALVGMQTGQTKRFDITYPENYAMPELAGSTVTYQVTLQSFTRPAKLTGEWAAAQGYESEEDFREAVRQELQDARDSQVIDYGEEFWKLVLENSEVADYPEQDLLLGIEEYRLLTESYAAYAQMDVASFLRSQNITEEEYEALAIEYAKSLVRQNLIVQAILDTEGVDLYGEEAEAVREKLAASYGEEDAADLEKRFGGRQVDESVGLLLVKQILEGL